MRQLIDSTNLDQWFIGKRRDAQELLPHLVRKLIAATIPPHEIVSLRIPAGDDIGRPGFDGKVEVKVPNQWVPDGLSVWEMGTNADALEKAEKDYIKRVGEGETTFVFVTPHACNSVKWVNDKKADAKWKDIRFLDNVELAAWIEDAPAVARWLARQMGIPAEGISELELFAAEFTATYARDISDKLIIGGRTEAVEKLQGWFGDSASEIRVEGESTEEAAAFIVAAVRTLPAQQREIIESRLVFVDRPESLEYLASLLSPHFVVPLSAECLKRARALHSANLRLLIPTSRIAGRPGESSTGLVLGRMRRQGLEDSLRDHGLTPRRAEQVAVESKGSFTAVLWMIAREIKELQWLANDIALELVPLVMAGQWVGDNIEDRKIIERLAAKDYSHVESLLAKWQAPAGPLIRRGDIWDWLAWDFAWLALAPHIDSGRLTRFRDAVKTVLATSDPSLELSPYDRFAAEVYGKRHPYSKALRTGLIGSIVQLAVNEARVPGGRGQAMANSLVHELLSGSGSSRKQVWLSLAPWLPDLAEAAPAAFLDVMRGFRQDKDAIAEMFAGPVFFGPNPHVHLLWALERLAWSKEFFTATVLELGDIAAVDPGGQLRNRPMNSLVQIFLPWDTKTSADVTHRLDAIDLLFRRCPEIGWNLAKALLPGDHDVSSPTDIPRWREWKSDDWKGPTQTEYWQFVHGLIQKMSSWASTKAIWWKDLIDKYPELLKSNPDLAMEMLAQLQRNDPETINDEDRIALTDTLRATLAWHRDFSVSAGGLSESDLRPLDALYLKLQPIDVLARERWLFTGWPALPNVKRRYNHDEHERQLHAERLAAAQRIVGSHGLAGITKLASLVGRPDLLGFVIAEIELPSEFESGLLRSTLSVEPLKNEVPPLLQLGIGFVRVSVRQKSLTWAEHATGLAGISWDSNMFSNLAWGMPAEAGTWDRLESWGQEASDLYWVRSPIDYLPNVLRDGERAVKNLLAANRPYRALYIAEDFVTEINKQKGAVIPAELIRNVLQKCPKHLPQDEWFSPALDMLGYHVEILLNALEGTGEENSLIASLEWMWLPVLERGQRGLKALQHAIVSHPPFFLELLRAQFRADNEEQRDPTDHEKIRARQAYTVLRECREVPGLIEAKLPGEVKEGDIAFSIGRVDETILINWIAEARKGAEALGLLDVCDSQIGQILARAPADPDRSWPCTAVRNAIESVASEALESGLSVGVYNSRGVHFRGRGGNQDRELAAKFRDYAERILSKWPRTAAVLRSLAHGYEREGKHHDERADFEEFER